MRRQLAIGLLVLSLAPFAAAQQAASPTPPPARDTPPATQIVNYPGPGITPPELIPAPFATEQVQHCRKWDGTALLSAVIDPSGQARDVYFLLPIGDDLDKQALKVVAADRFKPGSLNGAPIAVGAAIQVKMEFCVEPISTGPNAGAYKSTLRSPPEQTIEPLSKVHASSVPVSGLKPNKGVLPPVPLNSPSTSLGPAKCTVRILVDEHGMPQDLKVVKGASEDSCRGALQAASQQRYKPAMKDGEPMAVTIDFVFDGIIF
jgi:hypothetical protein